MGKNLFCKLYSSYSLILSQIFYFYQNSLMPPQIQLFWLFYTVRVLALNQHKVRKQRP